MPYVSPRGTVKSTMPTKQAPVPQDLDKLRKFEEHVPSIALGEVNSRDRNPSIVQKLDYWKGWGAHHEPVSDEQEDIDPLDEAVESQTSEKIVITERFRNETKLSLTIVTKPNKRVVSISEIEVDERFISDELL